MRVLSPAWVGTRTTEYATTAASFGDVLGLGVHSADDEFAVPRARARGRPVGVTGRGTRRDREEMLWSSAH